MIALSSLLTFVLTMAVVILVVWILVTYVPMPDPLKRVFLAIVAIVLLVWLLRFLGLLA